MVKKREGYRPFAPSVLEERVHDFFEVPAGLNALPFMTFVVGVRPEARQSLGAITHVDGTARPQTVARDVNPKYWSLIKAFEAVTGVPVLLNTSFNNNAEPIVESVEDALASFVTTGLDYVVVGDYIIRRRELSVAQWLSMFVSLPPYVRVYQTHALTDSGVTVRCEIGTSYKKHARVPISQQLWRCLTDVRSGQTIGDLFRATAVAPEQQDSLVAEIIDMWSKRLVVVRPYPGTLQHQQDAELIGASE